MLLHISELPSLFESMSADYYERLFLGDQEMPDQKFYLGFAKKYDKHRVLDLGCGSGRITFYLAKSGIDVTGVDNSNAMMGIARAKLAKSNDEIAERVHLVFFEMQRYCNPNKFDFAIYSDNTFNYLKSTEERIAALTSAYKSLEIGGHLIIDAAAFESESSVIGQGGTPRIVGIRRDPQNGHIVTFSAWSAVNPSEQHTTSVWVIETISESGVPLKYIGQYEMWHVKVDELTFLLNMVGFRQINVFSSYSDEIYQTGRSRQFVATKA
jgi:SAM-dependent methyltransferase